AELSKIKQAVSITSKAWKEFLKYLRSGSNLSRLTEKRMADKLEFLLRKQGAVKSAFDIIAACGANISRPHAVPGQTQFKKSQPVLFDFGAVYQDYQSDVTRNFLINKPLGKYQKIYRVVQQAQALAIKAVKPGVRIGLIDNISRSYIADKGFGKYFGHALGHGIGLEVHEGPVITGKNKNRLVPGMVFSIEPGIYIPGWGGVRIEDMVLVTEKGSEVLTNGIDESV
ncbi:MAG: aminopeptidase P family protein, partial [Candidatus Omnitrophica bacterium]|nr:aminopeptidase P family protein [Candidatus Omnitrophota bacterium]